MKVQVATLEQVLELDQRFRGITAGKGLPIIPGSLLELPADKMRAWGIQAIPADRDGGNQPPMPAWGVAILPRDRTRLFRLSSEYYLAHMLERRSNPAMERLVQPEMRKRIEERMAVYIGELVRLLIESIAGRPGQGEEIHVCEMPTRDGLATGRIIKKISEEGCPKELRSRLVFHLVDSSKGNLDVVRQNLPGDLKVHIYEMQDLDFLARAREQQFRFDVMVSLSHFHHKSFLTPYLAQIRLVMKGEGALVVGDRHSCIWDHPKNALEMLRIIGAEQRTQDAFRDFFGAEHMQGDPDVRLEDDEKAALHEHFNYWKEISDTLKGSNLEPKLPVHFLEASDTSKARIRKLEQVRLSVDRDDIRRVFPGLDVPPVKKLNITDFPVVMLAVKRAKGMRAREG